MYDVGYFTFTLIFLATDWGGNGALATGQYVSCHDSRAGTEAKTDVPESDRQGNVGEAESVVAE